MGAALLTWIFHFHISAASSACFDIFSLPPPHAPAIPASILKHGESLLPEMALATKSLLEIYYLALETHERVSSSKEDLPPQLHSLLLQTHSSRYELPTTAAEIKIFQRPRGLGTRGMAVLSMVSGARNLSRLGKIRSFPSWFFWLPSLAGSPPGATLSLQRRT